MEKLKRVSPASYYLLIIGIAAIFAVGAILFLGGLSDDSDDLMVAGSIVLGSAVALIGDAYIALQFFLAAADKGYEDAKYFWLSLFTFPGYLLVAALPDRHNDNRTDSDDLPDL